MKYPEIKNIIGMTNVLIAYMYQRKNPPNAGPVPSMGKQA